MKKVLFATAFVLFGFTAAKAGVWEAQCAGCHNGSLAPSKAQLRTMWKNKEAFVKAALNSTSPMMSTVKSNKAAIEEAAKEVYGK